MACAFLVGMHILNRKSLSGIKKQDRIHCIKLNATERALPYRLFIPKNYNASTKYPLVLFLHGAGESGTDNSAQVSNNEENGQSCLVQKFSSSTTQSAYPSFVVAPQCPLEPEKWVDTDWELGSFTNVPISDEMNSVVAILALLRKEFSIDSTRIYATGLSMGGFGTWDIIERNPKLFAAALPICGGADTAKSKVALIKDMPIWTFHGAIDGIVPVSGTRQMVAALKAHGSPVKYNEIPNCDHDAWARVCTTTAVIPWIYAQKRSELTRVNKPLGSNVCMQKSTYGNSDLIYSCNGRVLASTAGRIYGVVVVKNVFDGSLRLTVQQ